MSYAQMPNGLILPHQLAAEAMGNMLYPNHGAYRAASSRNKNTLGWHAPNGSADADTLADLPTLRRQSRDLCRNDGLPAGAINTIVGGVVGTGIMPQPRIDAAYLGLDAEAADQWQRQAARVLLQVLGRPHFDAAGRQTFWQQQQTGYRSVLESGDALVLRRHKPRAGKALGLSAQLVEADRLATPCDKTDNPNIRAGIEYSDDGEPAFYWAMKKHPGESLAVPDSSAFEKIPARDSRGQPLVLHVCRQLRPGQTRGVPHLAPVVELLKQLSRYTEAEISAAVISAMLAVFVKSDAPVSPLSGGIIPGQVGGQQVAPAGNGLQKLQSGMIIDLAPGEDITVANATRPNTAFDPFVISILRQIAVGLEIPFEVLIKHFTASYSASRAALVDAHRFYLRERDAFVVSYCQPVYEWAINEAVALGLLNAPGFFTDPLAREAWLGCEWVGEGMPQIDPLKEAKAAREWNDIGVWSLQHISAQQNLDFDATHAQLTREKQLREQAGLMAPPSAITDKDLQDE